MLATELEAAELTTIEMTPESAFGVSSVIAEVLSIALHLPSKLHPLDEVMT